MPLIIQSILKISKRSRALLLIMKSSVSQVKLYILVKGDLDLHSECDSKHMDGKSKMYSFFFFFANLLNL